MDPKTINESRFETAQIMQPHEANPAGTIHGGVVMKYIDNTAAVVAFRHARTNAVTASIDRLDFFCPTNIGNLLILKASLNLVGKSSMEIGVRVETEDMMTGEVKHVSSAYLTFVAIDENGKPAEIPELKLDSEEDIRRNSEAKDRKMVRLAERRNDRDCC
ncbi:MAG: acyl-CoA thioesterase [Desulfobacterales bacterium]|nr:acyl-CoA thioesterase [Desulfobacterales bacterium]